MLEDADARAELVRRVSAGDGEALAVFYARQRNRLTRMVAFRMDPRLRGRVGADDVVQEAYLDAVKRLRHFVGDTPEALFVWLRMIVTQTLVDLHRKHLGAQMRDAGREVAMHAGGAAQSTSASLAVTLVGGFTSPTLAARREELAERLRATLEQMDPIDREVLALRHFEELSNSEVAAELEIQQKTASIRYVRALRRLKEIIAAHPELADALDGAL